MNSYVTPIELLPDLEDLEESRENYSGINKHIPGGDIFSGKEGDKYKNIIRKNQHSPPFESGMIQHPAQMYQQHGSNQMYQQHGSNQMYQQHGSNQMYQQHDVIDQPHVVKETFSQAAKMNCVDVSNHISDCPICSKFYKKDNTIFIISIAVLCFIILILLKKVLKL